MAPESGGRPVRRSCIVHAGPKSPFPTRCCCHLSLLIGFVHGFRLPTACALSARHRQRRDATIHAGNQSPRDVALGSNRHWEAERDRRRCYEISEAISAAGPGWQRTRRRGGARRQAGRVSKLRPVLFENRFLARVGVPPAQGRVHVLAASLGAKANALQQVKATGKLPMNCSSWSSVSSFGSPSIRTNSNSLPSVT